MAADSYSIDTAHSTIGFSVRHLMIAKVRGRFGKFSGTIELDEAEPTRSRVEVEVDVGSIDTADEKRDGHLRSPDFFDVAKHPRATFVSKKIKRSGEEYDIEGELSLHGVTQPLTLRATLGGRAKDPSGTERAAFSARTTIDREAFGIKFNRAIETGGVAIGAKVELDIDVEASRAG